MRGRGEQLHDKIGKKLILKIYQPGYNCPSSISALVCIEREPIVRFRPGTPSPSLSQAFGTISLMSFSTSAISAPSALFLLSSCSSLMSTSESDIASTLTKTPIHVEPLSPKELWLALDIARLRLSAVSSLPLGDKEADVLCGVLLVCGWRETGMSISRTAEDLDLDELHQRQVGDEGREERERVLLKRVHALGVTDIGCTKGGWCYSASSERKLLLYKLMCIVLCCFRDSLI
jgi:hypothetical protein